ncbi:MAG TPA: aldolase/citrate lyase family protein [Pirellulales bacterium]|nr:aldolase/citrate lyase family protein [Pirellulales bacterium]
MRVNRVKRILQSGKPSFGTWLSSGDLFASRMLARLDFDWLTLDLEHGPIDWSQAAMIFGAIADAGGVPLARVPRGSHDHIKRVLDGGAWGIVVPMVDTVEQAKIAIAAAKYPPIGNRSLGGGMHAMNFDCSSAEYFARANEEILVVLQTESPTGVKNAREIYSLPGVDAIFVGPVDLRAQMRSPDGQEASDAEFEATLAEIVRIGKETGTPTGMHVMSASAALDRARQGMQFIAVGSELRMMAESASGILKQLRPEGPQKEVVRY